MNELDLFAALVALNDPAERAALLDHHGAGQPELRRRLERLLAAHFQSNPLLDPTNLDPLRNEARSVDMTADYAELAEQAGSVVADKYKLLQQIGEGGMGTVWMADQSQPVKRRVAVKLIRVERGQSKTILARFEAERQAIALMDHPHIAKLLDAGTTASGAPYFVMELVKGIPLTEYCDQHRLSIPDRLTLFAQICGAVQHAHQKGIIHRDLKPSNILVESHDGRPVPKIIDFGLAKATSGMQLTDHSLFTAFGSVMGTPLYMAPEQANFNAIDVDTRADIYSLGVILYELLTGSTPITRESLKKVALDEMLKLIREQESPTPSSRLSTAASAPSVAANRQIEPGKLGRFVKGELDWIVLKALSKERDRRYETANGFARDIERFLSHEPVQAGPPSAVYKFRKFVQRNRGQVIAATLVLGALLLGIIGTTWGLWEARKQTELAQRETIAKDTALKAEAARAEGERLAKQEAEAKRQEAVRNLGYAVKVNEVLGSVFVTLHPRENYATVSELRDVLKANLKTAIAELDGAAIGEPIVVAQMQFILGNSLFGLGDTLAAITLFEKARDTFQAEHGFNHPETLSTMNFLGFAYLSAGQLDKALPLLEETLKLQKSVLGPDHYDTLTTMDNLAAAYRSAGRLDLALPLFKETLELKRSTLGDTELATLASMNNLAEAYKAAGQLDVALPLYEQTLELMQATQGNHHPTTLSVMGNLATAYQSANQLDKAMPLLKETLNLQKAKLGTDHPNTLLSMSNLASSYSNAAQYDLALPLLERTLELTKAKMGANHPDTLMSMNNLAATYLQAGQLDRALPLLIKTLPLLKDKLGTDHPDTLTSMNNLALAYLQLEQPESALPLLAGALELTKTLRGADHSDTFTSMNNLASACWFAGQLDRALQLFEETLAGQKATRGPDHPDTLHTLINLAAAYQKSGQHDRAMLLLEEAYAASTSQPTLARVGAKLLNVYVQADKTTQAAALVPELLSQARTSLAEKSPQLAGQLASYGLSLLQLKSFTAAEPLLRECLDIRKAQEPDTWTTFNTMSLLGGALLGQEKYTEAEPLLLAGYEGMKQRENTIPPPGKIRLPEALDRLISLYQLTENAEAEQKWSQEMALYTAKEGDQ